MKRATSLGYFGALLLVAGSAALAGCADEYGTYEAPRVEGFLPEEPSPARILTVAPARQDIVASWQLHPGDPWIPYEKLTLPSVLADSPAWLDLPIVEELDQVRLAHRAAARVAAEGLAPRTAWFVDLAGAASVAFGTSLSKAASVSVVPTFNNWPADGELVPAEETLAAMTAMTPKQPDVAAPPVFLFDSWRLAYKEEEIGEDTIDNRYMLTSSDLPTAEALRAQGITQVVYLVASPDIETEEDDLHDVFAAYEEAGIVIYLVDLESLARGPDEVWSLGWYVEARAHCFHVRRRLTVVHDPRFFRRSRGGFGGGHVSPVPNGHVHSGFHGGG